MPQPIEIAEDLIAVQLEAERKRIVARYSRRAQQGLSSRYLFTEPSVYMALQEKERAMLHWIRSCGICPVENKRLLEIGCGTGSDLLWFLRTGFVPENIVGNELLPERAVLAAKRLPTGCTLLHADALSLHLDNSAFDIVYQSTVFSSILDEQFQQRLAARIWRWLRPGGGVLWYDFVCNNPRNLDVRGIPLKRIPRLFPQGRVRSWPITLAPPISRLVTSIHPSLYTLCNTLPLLRTHALCWIEKA